MKFHSLKLALVSLVVSASSFAIFNPSWDRPIYRAELTHVTSNGVIEYPMAQSITMYRKDGSLLPTLFSMTFDTGIRCIMAPCPSSETRTFRVTGHRQYRNGSVDFYAIEQLKNIPRNVRIAPLRLTVRDNRKAKFGNPEWMWEVTLSRFTGSFSSFGGNPEGVITIQ